MCIEYILLQLCLGGQDEAILVGSIYHEYLILIGDKFLGGGIDFVESDTLIELLDDIEVVLGGNHWFPCHEVVQSLAHEVAVATVVALSILALGTCH